MVSSRSGLDYEQIREGITHLWNNRFTDADKLFGAQKDNLPRYALHYAEVAFLKSFTTADVNDTQTAVDRLQHARKIAEQHIKAYEAGHEPNDATKKIADQVELFNKLLDAKIVLGDSLYMGAVLQMTHNEKLKGALNLRKSWKVFEGALKERKKHEVDDELSKCLEFGAGFFLFAMSIIPPKFLKIVELAGFKADREGGLHYIRETHKSGSIRAPFATMVMLFNNLLLPRGVANVEKYLKEADELVTESLAKYPSGSLFQVMGSHSARKQCNVEQGIKFMQDALSNCSSLEREPLIFKYELANCYCMKLDWEKAIEQFNPLVKEEKFQVRIICGLQLGGAYMMAGQPQKAFELFQLIQTWPGKKSQFDQIAQRQAKRYLANGGHFSAFELLYLRRDLAKMLPIMPRVLEALEQIASKTKANEKKVIKVEKPSGAFGKLGKFGAGLSKISLKKKDNDYQYDDRAAYLLYKGSMLKALGKNAEAVECFKEVIDELSEVLVEKLFVPYCCYELGESYFVMGKLKEAEEMFKKCGKYSGYDWEDPLRVRLKVTFDQLKKGESAAPPLSLDALADKMAETKIDDKEIDENSLAEHDDDEPEFKEESDN